MCKASVALTWAAAASHHSMWPSQLCHQAGWRHLSSDSGGTDGVRSALAYCVQQVKKYEHDNYIWVSQLPKEHRPAVFALRAFNIETALVVDQVRSRESALIQVRYQWWREGVAAAFKGDPPRHPVLVALQAALAKQRQASSAPAAKIPSSAPAAPKLQGCGSQADSTAASSSAGPVSSSIPGLRQYHLKRMIDAREADALDTQPPLDMSGLEQYAEGTLSQLLYLQLAAVGVQNRDADHAASHLGKALGLTTLLRGTPFHASQRRSYLPIELCVQHNVSQEDVYAGNATEGLRDVVLAVASVAKGHLDEARALANKLPKPAASVMLASLATEEYLQALEAANFDPFSPSLQPRSQQGSSLKHVLRVKYHQWAGTF